MEEWTKEYGIRSNNSIAAVWTDSVGMAFLPFTSAQDGNFCTQREKESGADRGTIELTSVLSVSYGGSEVQTPELAAKRICH
jgi:hypothetical protein